MIDLKILSLTQNITDLENENAALEEKNKKLTEQKSELQNENGKLKNDTEKLLKLLKDHGIIRSWYYNGSYHWEENER